MGFFLIRHMAGQEPYQRNHLSEFSCHRKSPTFLGVFGGGRANGWRSRMPTMALLRRSREAARRALRQRPASRSRAAAHPPHAGTRRSDGRKGASGRRYVETAPPMRCPARTCRPRDPPSRNVRRNDGRSRPSSRRRTVRRGRSPDPAPRCALDTHQAATRLPAGEPSKLPAPAPEGLLAGTSPGKPCQRAAIDRGRGEGDSAGSSQRSRIRRNACTRGRFAKRTDAAAGPCSAAAALPPAR